MKVLLDENVANKIKEGLIELELEDVKHINDIGKGIPDEEVFQLAQKDDRVLITGDDDFKANDFKYKIPIIWITPKARQNDNIPKLIKWILENLNNYNIDIRQAFISIRKMEYFIEYKNPKKIFTKVKTKTIDFKKINRKTNKP